MQIRLPTRVSVEMQFPPTEKSGCRDGLSPEKPGPLFPAGASLQERVLKTPVPSASSPVFSSLAIFGINGVPNSTFKQLTA